MPEGFLQRACTDPGEARQRGSGVCLLRIGVHGVDGAARRAPPEPPDRLAQVGAVRVWASSAQCSTNMESRRLAGFGRMSIGPDRGSGRHRPYAGGGGPARMLVDRDVAYRADTDDQR